jgi:GTP-binding protein HflX
LILHVRDIAHEETEAQARDVEKVLGDLGIDTLPAESHILEVWNKIDLLPPERVSELKLETARTEKHPVTVSAVTGEGLEELFRTIDERLGRTDEIVDCVIPAAEGRLLAYLYDNADVMARESEESGDVRVKVRVTGEKKARIIGQLRKAGVAV